MPSRSPRCIISHQLCSLKIFYSSIIYLSDKFFIFLKPSSPHHIRLNHTFSSNHNNYFPNSLILSLIAVISYQSRFVCIKSLVIVLNIHNSLSSTISLLTSSKNFFSTSLFQPTEKFSNDRSRSRF